MKFENTVARPLPLVTDERIARALRIVLFAALSAVGAQLAIPHQPVPYTLQTFFVLLSGAYLGKRDGAISQFLYLLAGAAGAPVFAGWGFGFAHLLGPTGGYLLSFPVASFVVGYLAVQRRNFLRSAISMAAGLFVVFSLGAIQLNFVYFHDWSLSIRSGLLAFTWWDGVKLIAAAVLATRLKPSARQ